LADEVSGDSSVETVVTEETEIQSEVVREIGPERVQHALIWGAILGIVVYLMWQKFEWIPRNRYPATAGTTSGAQSQGLGEGTHTSIFSKTWSGG
jgi:hypothetical protein